MLKLKRPFYCLQVLTEIQKSGEFRKRFDMNSKGEETTLKTVSVPLSLKQTEEKYRVVDC